MEYLYKFLPFILMTIFSIGGAWVFIKMSLKYLEKTVDADRLENTKRQDKTDDAIEKLSDGVHEIKDMMITSQSAYEAAQKVEKAALEQRLSNTDKRMNLQDDRNNIIAATNRDVVEEVNEFKEEVKVEMKALTAAVINNIGVKPKG